MKYDLYKMDTKGGILKSHDYIGHKIEIGHFKGHTKFEKCCQIKQQEVSVFFVAQSATCLKGDI